MRTPCFDNVLKVLRKEAPDRPTLFEFFHNQQLYERIAGFPTSPGKSWQSDCKLLSTAFQKMGYDYSILMGSDFTFPSTPPRSEKTYSLNDGVSISDRESYDRYHWPDAETYDYSRLEEAKKDLPEGMKLIVWGPGGILENAIMLCGYDNLCMMMYDDEELLTEIFDQIGSRFLKYYQICAQYDTVGAMIGNDDWGFNTQTMLQPSALRKYVFPWHKRIVEAIHAQGKPAILHSCGFTGEIMDDIIYDMKYDAKHSYEDKILPIEQAYDRYNGQIALLGGIDIDFLCRSTPEEVYKRSKAMVERGKIGYALGSGNSIPYYVPEDNFFSMISAVTGKDPRKER